MKFKVQVLVAGACLVMVSCGSNSSDKEVVATQDTVGTTTVQTVETTTIEVPPTTRTVFETKYPQASNVRWSYYRPEEMSAIEWDWTGWPAMDSADYYTQFNWQGSDYWAWYDEQGNWVGTVSMVDHASLPAAVNGTINSQYNGYTITSVSKENDKDRTAYEVTMEKGADKAKILVDENGKILKKKTVIGNIKTKEKTNSKDTAM